MARRFLAFEYEALKGILCISWLDRKNNAKIREMKMIGTCERRKNGLRYAGV